MKEECNDKNCPIHGQISVRGKVVEGKIIRMKAQKTAVIEIKTTKFIRKYERYLTEKSRLAVHCPDCMEISVGDWVLCGETRKLSKTKAFVVLKKLDVAGRSKVEVDIEDKGKVKSKKKEPGEEK